MFAMECRVIGRPRDEGPCLACDRPLHLGDVVYLADGARYCGPFCAWLWTGEPVLRPTWAQAVEPVEAVEGGVS